GRHVTMDSGGDVLVLANQGLLSISKLLQGVNLADRSIYETFKISPLISQQIALNGTTLGWQLITNPNDQTLNISIPQNLGLYWTHFAMSYQTRGWCTESNYPSQCMGVWQGQLYFGDGAGNLWAVGGNQDMVLLSGTGGTDITWSLFGSFQGMNASAKRKRSHMVKPAIITPENPISLVGETRFDFDLTTNTAPTPISTQGGGNLWDSGKWDQALWGAGVNVQAPFLGALGTGYMVAMLLSGLSSTPTTVANLTLYYDQGGEL